MAAGSVARPSRYSQGGNRLAYYRLDFLTINRGAPARLGDYVLDRPTHIVRAGEQDADLERYLRREGERLRFVTRRHPACTLGLLAALRRNEAVAMQGDRPTGERGDTEGEFFGAPAPFEPPVWVKSGEELAALTAMAATLERAVRAHPAQWFNFFDVWSPPRAAA